MSLADILDTWFAGNSVSGTKLWGLQIIWWARIGKLAQFLSALTVILDLVGTERLISFRSRSRTRYLRSMATARRAGQLKVRLFNAWEKVGSSKSPNAGIEALEGSRHIDFLLALALPIAPFIGAAMLHEGPFGYTSTEEYHAALANPRQLPSTFLGLFGLFLLFFILASLGRVIAYIGVIRTAIGLGIVAVATYPATLLLGGREPAYGVRWAAVLVFVAGFALDLLGS